jgi:hypothetical protein
MVQTQYFFTITKPTKILVTNIVSGYKFHAAKKVHMNEISAAYKNGNNCPIYFSSLTALH